MLKLNKHQQLGIIEGLCLAYDNGTEDLESAKKILSSVYKIAHLNGTCENEHNDWHKEGFKLIEEFKQCGLTDIRRYLWVEKLRRTWNNLIILLKLQYLKIKRI